ncbi:MAG: YggS family pyridoxal phosphate-dependent enzyme [Pelagibacteraceae bacterium]|nr:YggS family pyridoxal phosphate-dependent enzyme [Pelagibacteraceae bacterium]|tara:strand:+ start:60311 stop:60955 length:645 start_codon:yes stop_codon:yes gene_type:complete
MFNFHKYTEIKEFIEKNGKKTKIIAISKNHPKTAVSQALSHGIRVFGENRVQEAIDKFQDLKKNYSDIQIHLTGTLQTNKVKLALDWFDVFHTVDREKLVKEFLRYPDKLNGKDFFIQINTGLEGTKSGIDPDEAYDFINYCISEAKINVVGLMCIPPKDDDPLIHFGILEKIATKNNLKELSIGMSNDYKQAIMQNAKYIRLGTILFGERKYD